MLTDGTKKRRMRGSSPRGKFEDSKAVALAIIEDRKAAEKATTEALRAARLARSSTGGHTIA